MFNLLPEKYEKELHSEYNHRRVIIIAAFIGLLGLIAILLIVPFFILARSEVRSIEDRISNTRQITEDEESRSLRSELNVIQSKLTLLRETRNGRASGLLLEAINESGDEIKLTSITYRSSEQFVFQIALAGIANNREALRSFGDRLESRESFASIDLPVSNFADENDIRFSLTIMGHEQEE